MKTYKIAIIGGGRVGLPAAAGFAAVGHRVTCCEIDQARREAAAAGRAPFEDDGLEDAIKTGLANGNLRFCGGIADAVADADAAFIAVPTKDGEGGLRLLFEAAREAARHGKEGMVLVVKSTVPPGTCGELAADLGGGAEVVSNPEFLRQGSGLRDFLQPPRIVVGADNAAAAEVMRGIYAPLAQNGAEYAEVGRAGAEMAKLAANMFLASRVALINELADLCEATGADIGEVARVVGADDRIGGKYLRPGVGFGGACLPKDGALLSALADRRGVEAAAIKAIYASNAARAGRLAKRILAAAPAAPTVAAWGAAFKPGADDARASPALAVIAALCAGGATVRVCEPAAAIAADALPAGCIVADNYAASLSGADCLAVLVAPPPPFPSPEEIRRQMNGVLVFDYAGALDGEKARRAGLFYETVGAPVIPPGAV